MPSSQSSPRESARRQKQAAAAKAQQAAAKGGDGERAAFTAVSHPDQPSAWARDALAGGALVAAALVLACAWGLAGPRGAGSGPAPARAHVRRR